MSKKSPAYNKKRELKVREKLKNKKAKLLKNKKFERETAKMQREISKLSHKGVTIRKDSVDNQVAEDIIEA